MLTGESKPVRKSIDEEVIGGAINGSGAIKVKVKGIGEDTYLSKVITMVQSAQKQVEFPNIALLDKCPFFRLINLVNYIR